MTNNEKIERLKEIKELIQDFCDKNLNGELEGYSMKLCDKLGRNRSHLALHGEERKSGPQQ